MESKNKIVYSIIEPNEGHQIADFLLDNFFPNEPISRALTLPRNQIERWFPNSILSSVKQGYSFKAVDDKSGQLVGVAINILLERCFQEKQVSEGRGLLDILDREREPIMVEIAEFLAILNKVPNEVYRQTFSNNGKITSLNCIYLNVLKQYRGQGIGKLLIEKSEQIARANGVTFLQVDTTSQFSYQIFDKCGFSTIREIPLKDYINGIQTIDDGFHKYGRILIKTIHSI